MQIREALALGISCLKEHQLESASLDAALILGGLLQLSRTQLIAHDKEQLEPALLSEYQARIQKRSKGYPVAYILGYKDFYGLKLEVTEQTLIPRPDTETLVEAALERKAVRRVLDLGTGSGAIILALKANRPQWECAAGDLSSSTLDCARRNAQRLQLQVDFRQGSWFEPFLQESFDLIVSNPPYIASSDEHLHKTSLPFEPQQALVSGADGLDALREICAQVRAHLNPGGAVMLEHGYDQGENVRALLDKAGFLKVYTLRDLGGQERVSVGELEA
ncbi:MAG: peptide chain release factor N(5)-glutamine methyltransferase [Succinivibrio sp.]|nr:peptide chain release factor N(5)-glutamine methyltransferase [Succinivibrio sp.]